MLTEKDEALLEEAYSTSYKSTVRKLIKQADTDLCRRMLTELLTEMPE